MITIDRSRPPPLLSSKAASAALDAARSFYARPPRERAQVRYEWPSLHHDPEVRDALITLTHGKCAFCESVLVDRTTFEVVHFRPRADALSLSGRRYPEHYWWLALEWENLYPACTICSSSKGTRFPLAAPRTGPESRGADLVRENPLLLDPCAAREADNPERHLVFLENGTVAAVSFADLPSMERKLFGEPTRGQVTIDVFQLNRPELVAERRRVAEFFLTAGELTAPLLAREAPYLALKRQIRPTTPIGIARAERMRRFAFSPGGRGPLSPKRFHDDQVKRARAVASQEAWEATVAGSSVESADQPTAYFSRAAYLARVEVEGVGGIRHLAFDLEPGGGGGGGAADGGSGSLDGAARWLMLLGENGVGKTSILKAIALALVGPRRLESLLSLPAFAHVPQLFRPGGSVRVFLTSQTTPIEVRREGDRLVHLGEAAGAKVILRGFGPSRWFPVGDARPVESEELVRVENLFDPFVPLAPAGDFLLSLERRRWSGLARALKDLLQVGSEGRLVRRGGEVWLRQPGSPRHSLRHLSSGYEAVVALACDLAQLLFQRWDDPATAEGVVLLDEIDAHLHPRWKMRIVGSLRRAFPRVQFLASTHEPLCLRGLAAGEILVLRREEGKVVDLRPTESVADLRVDQILTSPIFGLHTTLDPEHEERMDRYYQLLSRHEEARTAEEREELAALEATVGASGLLGSTRRDQVLYRFIDELVAREPLLDAGERRQREQWTQEQVEAFWAGLDAPPEAEA